jgi:hypothetical protein
MEVRCAGCSKLFRVSDDKITGSGIKFGCSRCGVTVKITSEEFERYKLSREAASALASFEPKPPKASAPFESDLEVWQSGDPAPHPDFDLSDPATAAAAMQQGDEHPPVFIKPEAPEPVKIPAAVAAAAPQAEAKPVSRPLPAAPSAPTAPKVQPRPAPAHAVQPESKPASQPKQAAPVRPASIPPSASPRAKEAIRPVPVTVDAVSQRSTGNGKKAAIVVMALLLLGAGGFFAKSFLGGIASSSRNAIDVAKEVTPEGLQIMNASGGVDPVSGDLTISGVIENSTDNPRPAWYVVVDLLDAQGTTLMQAKLVSGKQFYTNRDMEILAKRGANVQELKMKQLQEQGIVVPARGSVSFEIRILEPPIGVANFNANLQPFDPVKLHKEMSEAQK